MIFELMWLDVQNKFEYMDGWMDGWMEGWMSKLLDRCIDGR